MILPKQFSQLPECTQEWKNWDIKIDSWIWIMHDWIADWRKVMMKVLSVSSSVGNCDWSHVLPFPLANWRGWAEMWSQISAFLMQTCNFILTTLFWKKAPPCLEVFYLCLQEYPSYTQMCLTAPSWVGSGVHFAKGPYIEHVFPRNIFTSLSC